MFNTSPTSDSDKNLDLENRVSKLQVKLENENLILDQSECLLQTLEQCLSMCADESLDKKILGKILPNLHSLLSQVVKAMDDATGDEARIDNPEDMKRKLRICDGLLSFWQTCVQRVSTIKKIPAHCVASLCTFLPETIKIIFEHCKASPKTYGILMNVAMQELRNLFLRAGAIFKLFFATLVDVIVFDTDVESETELLTKVVNAYGTIASIANGMDTKTLVEVSEAFAKLAVVYQSDIKHTSPSSVTTHLARMAKDVSHLLSTIKAQNDKNIERTIAVTTRLVKILEKLIAVYDSFLTYETLLHLVELSMQMHGCSIINITKDNERTPSINVASFLYIIFNHNNFKQAYFEYGRKTDVHRLNYHLLTIAVMKKLNTMPYERNCEWVLGLDSILDVALTYIAYIEEEMYVGELHLPGAYGIGERPRLADIYEATLVSICSLLSHIPPSTFHTLELLLLKHLLSGHFWSSLLSSDIWCFIGRLGPLQLCVDHVKYLMKVSAALAERRDSTEAIMLNNLIGRLYELLNEDAKSILLDEFVDPDTDYTPILYSLAAKTKNFRSKHSIYRLDGLSKAFANIREHPTMYNWRRFMQIVSAMQAVNYSDDITNILTKIWTFVVDVITTECEDKQLDLLSDFILILLDGTRFENLRDDTLDLILTSIASSCAYMPPRAKIKICQYLRQNVENLDRCDARSISALIELFSRLLEDESSWVCQEALESFKRIGHACSEHLVAKIAKTLARIPFINNIMQAYLSNMPYYVLEDFANVHDYLRHVAITDQGCVNHHSCYKYEESEREEKMARWDNENSQDIAPVTSMYLNEQAEGLYRGLTKALDARIDINEAICRKLINVLEKILKASEK